MSQFVQSRYQIISQREKLQDDKSPLAPSSPDYQQGVGQKRSNFSKLAIAGSVVALARTANNTVIENIREEHGNERLVNQINNIKASAGIIGITIATKGIALIPVVANELGNSYSQRRARARRNADRELEDLVRGSLNTSTFGGGKNYG